MTIETPPFDPPYVSICDSDKGTTYTETCADGTTQPASAERVLRMKSFGRPSAEASAATGFKEVKAQGAGKVYLTVPFAEKDEAKALGAKWDATKKKWYVPAGVDATLFSRWSPS